MGLPVHGVAASPLETGHSHFPTRNERKTKVVMVILLCMQKLKWKDGLLCFFTCFSFYLCCCESETVPFSSVVLFQGNTSKKSKPRTLCLK